MSRVTKYFVMLAIGYVAGIATLAWDQHETDNRRSHNTKIFCGTLRENEVVNCLRALEVRNGWKTP